VLANHLRACACGVVRGGGGRVRSD
jgi:hypothetical protein